jgi:hypothetical protein
VVRGINDACFNKPVFFASWLGKEQLCRSGVVGAVEQAARVTDRAAEHAEKMVAKRKEETHPKKQTSKGK